MDSSPIENDWIIQFSTRSMAWVHYDCRHGIACQCNLKEFLNLKNGFKPMRIIGVLRVQVTTLGSVYACFRGKSTCGGKSRIKTKLMQANVHKFLPNRHKDAYIGVENALIRKG